MDPQITPITLRDVLPDLEYEEFASTAYNVEFDDVDKFFFTLIQVDKFLVDRTLIKIWAKFSEVKMIAISNCLDLTQKR